jgi:hypothetical protein
MSTPVSEDAKGAIRGTEPTFPEEDDRSLPRFVPSLYQVGMIAVLGAVLLVGLAPRIDPDLWWHLESGRYIALHHVVPTRDFLSFTARGRPWTDHEWLSELLLYGLYRIGGLWGPIIFFALAICATFGLVYAATVRRGVHPILALFLLAGALVAASPALGARPQMVTLFFLAVYALVLLAFETGRDRRLLVMLPLLMLVWVNMHAGFVLGLALLALTVAGEWLNRMTRREGALSGGELRALAVALGVTALATVVNPTGVREVLYPLVWIFPTSFANSLTEWVSTDFHMPQMMVFEAMLLLLIGSFFVARPRVNWTHLLLVLAFTHLAVSQVRNVSVWMVLITPLLAVYLRDAFVTLQGYTGGLQYRRRPVRGRLAPILNVVLLLMMALVYVGEATHYINGVALKQNEQSTFPVGAVAYLQRHALPPHVFASYAWGGYVLWHLSPRYQDFIEGRANTVYTAQTLSAYLDGYSAAPDWQRVFSRYHVQDVLVDRGAPIAQVLALNPHWRRVFVDKVAVLYTRA